MVEDNAVAIRACQTGKNPTMRHLNRTHGITISWLWEMYQRGEYELVWEPSNTMAADIFTKSFSNPQAWDAACELVCICQPADVEALCGRAGTPPPATSGGGKRGIWCLNPDGSGTWTRLDQSAERFRDLWLSGPQRQEVTHRETYCAKTKELLDVTRDWPYCKTRCEPLPPPSPRSLRTVFYFDHTSKAVPPDAQRVDQCRVPEDQES